MIGRGHRLLALEAWIDDIADLGLTSARLDAIAAARRAARRFGILAPRAWQR